MLVTKLHVWTWGVMPTWGVVPTWVVIPRPVAATDRVGDYAYGIGALQWK